MPKTIHQTSSTQKVYAHRRRLSQIGWTSQSGRSLQRGKWELQIVSILFTSQTSILRFRSTMFVQRREVLWSKTIGAYSPMSFGLRTSLGTPFTMITPWLFQIMSNLFYPCLYTCVVQAADPNCFCAARSSSHCPLCWAFHCTRTMTMGELPLTSFIALLYRLWSVPMP